MWTLVGVLRTQRILCNVPHPIPQTPDLSSLAPAIQSLRMPVAAPQLQTGEAPEIVRAFPRLTGPLASVALRTSEMATTQSVTMVAIPRHYATLALFWVAYGRQWCAKKCKRICSPTGRRFGGLAQGLTYTSGRGELLHDY